MVLRDVGSPTVQGPGQLAGPAASGRHLSDARPDGIRHAASPVGARRQPETEDVHERRTYRAEGKRQTVLRRSHIKIMAADCVKVLSLLGGMTIS